MGVAALRSGIASRHATFSVRLHLIGRSFSLLIPFSIGPLHCGQFSAVTRVNETVKHQGTMINASASLRRMNLPVDKNSIIVKNVERVTPYGKTISFKGEGTEGILKSFPATGPGLA